MQMHRHRVHLPASRGTERILPRRRHKSLAYRILLYIPHTAHKLLFRRNLALVEAAHPNIELTLQAKRKAALDELHGLFKRNIRSRRNQSVEMIRHDDERMQEELPLTVIVEEGSLKQLCRSRNLKKAAALRRHS